MAVRREDERAIGLESREPDAIAGTGRPGGALLVQGRARTAQPAIVNGAAGAVWAPGGRPRVVFAFAFARGKIVEIEMIAERERLRGLDPAVLND